MCEYSLNQIDYNDGDHDDGSMTGPLIRGGKRVIQVRYVSSHSGSDHIWVNFALGLERVRLRSSPSRILKFRVRPSACL